MAKNGFFKLFIDADDVARLHGCSKSRAYERLKEIARFHNLKPYQRVTVFQFCEYEGIPKEDMIALKKETGIF